MKVHWLYIWHGKVMDQINIQPLFGGIRPKPLKEKKMISLRAKCLVYEVKLKKMCFTF